MQVRNMERRICQAKGYKITKLIIKLFEILWYLFLFFLIFRFHEVAILHVTKYTFFSIHQMTLRITEI